MHLHAQPALTTELRELHQSYVAAGHHNLSGVPVGGLIPEPDHPVPG